MAQNKKARFAVRIRRWCASLALAAAAGAAALTVWDYYVLAPWTRDGRIRVQVASVAPQVSGQIVELRVSDNQYVRKGDVLYVIDPFDYRSAFAAARTDVKMRAADLQVKAVQSDRRQHLSDLATTAEQQQLYAGQATQAQAMFEAAEVREAQAEVDLERTEVRSPVDGFVTNLLLRVGDYAHAGASDVSVIDAASYWVDGYFEETKMARVCVGDAVEARLMGYARPILGRVETVTRGISVSDATPGTQSLPSVDPVYTWVRLAQRVPVRIRITEVPAGVPLVSGMTVTVSVRDGEGRDAREPWWRARYGAIQAALLGGPEPRPSCLPPAGPEAGAVATLATPEPARPRAPDEVNPGLAPGMAASPDRVKSDRRDAPAPLTPISAPRPAGTCTGPCALPAAPAMGARYRTR